MNIRRMRTALLGVLFAAGVGALPTPSVAKDDPSNSRVVEGVAIYFGVMPAEMVQGHPKEHPEAQMHGGAPGRGHRDHVVVALFDSASGRRIENADVTASVMEVGLAGQWKTLEPMKIAGTVTYGNYFDFPSKDAYHITVRIHIPGKQGAIETKFGHQHFGQ